MNKNITAIVDYGVGNIFSLKSSLAIIGANAVVTDSADVLSSAARIILPGVGAFEDAIGKLSSSGLDKTIISCADNGKPLLGICLGMQMLFDRSYEYGEHKGLGLIPGAVVPLKERLNNDLKVPHIGWNKLDYLADDALFKYLNGDAYAYYVHSYYAETSDEYIIARSEYGISVTGAVRNKNVFGTQFHPEKSGNQGLLMLKAFCEEV